MSEWDVAKVGTCECCKREERPLRAAVDCVGETVYVCADLMRCALAKRGCPDEILDAEVAPGEMMVVMPGR